MTRPTFGRKSLLLVTLAAVALLALACAAAEEGNRGATSTVRSTPQAASPIARVEVAPVYEPLELAASLHDFAQRMDAALRSQDLQFFLENVKFVPTRCDVPFGWPASCGDPIPVPEGQKPRGIFVADRLVDMIQVTIWQSEGFGLDRAEYEPYIRQFVLSIDPAARDQYGDGVPRLHAVGRVRDEYRESGQDIDLIATSISGPRLDQFSYFGSEEGQRSMLSFGVEFDGSRWWIQHLTRAPLDYFLDPESPDAQLLLLESWQRWPPP